MKENHVFIEEENIPEKSVIVEEKLDGIRNVEDLLWLVLKQQLMVESLPEILNNISQVYKCPLCSK